MINIENKFKFNILTICGDICTKLRTSYTLETDYTVETLSDFT